MKKRYLFCPKIWLRTSLFVIVATVFSKSLYGQSTFTKQWEKSYGGKGEDFLWDVQATSDGGVIMGGSSNSGAEGGKSQPAQNFFEDIWVIKLDAQGNKQWDKTIGGNNGDEIRKVRQTADGGYVLFGESWSDVGGDKTEPCRGRPDFWLVKLDAKGNKLWDKTYGGDSDEIPRELAIMPDGGILMTGESYSGKNRDKTQGDGNNDYWLVKTDSKGNKLWDRTLEIGRKSEIRYFSRANDNGFLLGGFYVPLINIKTKNVQDSVGRTDFWVIKFDAKGNEIWNKHYGTETYDILGSMEPTPDGGCILGGKTNTLLAGKEQPDALIMKLDGKGNKIWEKTMGSPLDDYLRTIQPTPDKGYIVAGFSGQKVEGSTDMFDDWQAKYYWVTKLDENGNIIWEEKYESPKDKLGYLVQMPDKGFLLSGSYSRKDENQPEDDFSSGPPKRIHESWVTKLDAHGKKLWNTRISRKESHTYDTPELTKDFGFVLWGQELPEQDEADYWIIKFGPEGAVTPAKKPALEKVSDKPAQRSATPSIPARQQEETPDDRVYAYVQQEPSFPGGQNTLTTFLANSIKYPAAAKAKKTQGRVVVSFVVGKNGEIKDLTFLKGLSPEIDAEATRVVKSMPAWIPGKQDGKVVNVRVTMPIIFKLDTSAEKK